MTIMLRVILCGIVSGLFVFICRVSSKCTVSPLKAELTRLGNKRQFCSHKITTSNKTVQVQVMIGSQFQTPECVRCRCTRIGMECCGFGVADDSPLTLPPGCTAVADGCEIVLVSSYDIRRPCYVKSAMEYKKRQEANRQRELKNFFMQTNPRAWEMANSPEFSKPPGQNNPAGGPGSEPLFGGGPSGGPGGEAGAGAGGEAGAGGGEAAQERPRLTDVHVDAMMISSMLGRPTLAGFSPFDVFRAMI